MRGGIPDLCGVETDTDKAMRELGEIGKGEVKRGERVRFGQVSEKAKYQAAADITRVSVTKRLLHAVEHDVHRYGPREVNLRVKEDLCVDDVVSVSPVEIGRCQLAEVMLGD